MFGKDMFGKHSVLRYPLRSTLRRRAARTRLAALGLVLLGLASGLTPAPAQASPIGCQDVVTPVTLAGQKYNLYGKLCQPPGGSRTVQVLIPGSSYNSTYWDFPYTPDIRSFRLAMNNAGYATLTIDRLGTGRSDRPPSALLTAFTQADTVHQLVQALRAGTRTHAFGKVTLGGHSLGSSIAIIEAGTYSDVDGVLITGLTHLPNATGVSGVLASLIPAILDPKFAGTMLDPGYLTTRAGTRYDNFESPGTDVPQVTALDESTKDMFGTAEVVDGALISAITPYSLLIKAPVMVAMGQFDPTGCGPLATNCSTAATLAEGESPYYSPAARLQTFVLPNFGHSINLAPNTQLYQAAVANWANQYVGR
jgi:pimeloyl-ACP methyl ester carboxylesterase